MSTATKNKWKKAIHAVTALVLLCMMAIACSLDRAEIAFYVSPQGDDAHTGAIDAPFRTVERAQQAVRSLKQTGGFPPGGLIVYLRGGEYPLLRTLHFTAEDGGKEGGPVIYRAFPGEEVRFTGGREIRFEPLADGAARARIRAPHDQILQADLRAQGIDDFGRQKATGFGQPAETAPLELFFHGEPMTLARYPNAGEWMRIASVPQTGDTLLGGDERTGRGVHYGRFVYSEDRVAGWRENDEIWLQGYWTWDWADSYVKVARIDAARKEFILAPPYGVYGYYPGQRYYAMNILEELDTPGEWFLDRAEGLLYFWPPATVEEGAAVVSVMEELMVHLDHTEHLRLEGITFEYTRGSALKMEEGCYNTIGGCIVRNIGGDGIRITGGRHNGVSGCDLYHIGDAGIDVQGGDRLTLEPGRHFALNNHIYRYSRLNRTYRPAIRLSGAGNRMAHNCIHDAPHMAVSFSGNDHCLEYNEVYDIAQETGDVGAFYIGRDWTERGNLIRYNYFHHLSGPGLYGVNAVYLDDFASGSTIHGNIFYRAGKAAFIGGGNDNTVTNNVFIDCTASIHVDARGVNWASVYIGEDGNMELYRKLKAVNPAQPPYSERYPELARLPGFSPGQPKGNIFRSNLSYGGKWLDIEQDVDEVTIEDNFVLREIPPGVNAATGNLYPENESILERIHFQKIPFDRIGLYEDEYRSFKHCPDFSTK
ncbi:MAG: right-handed parallel beta-helix repeat-containing protein [Tannerella sp.]|nr:right-handed parallel beta-helix repeat-containing protein [Tannerella sp.]